MAEESNSSIARSNTTSMKTQTFIGKDGRLWSSTCPPSSPTLHPALVHQHACNMRHTDEGTLSDAKNIETEEKAFMLFINESMLRQIAKYTNVYAQKYLEANGKDSNDRTPVDLGQIKAAVGFLFLIGVYRSQNESFRLLWSSGISGRPIFPFGISERAFECNRFEQIVAYLRFHIRKIQSQTDKFAPFCQFLNKLQKTALRCLQICHHRSGVSKIFEQGPVCRFFWASSGQSQKCFLVVLPIKVFSKKKDHHLNFVMKSRCSLKKRSSPKFGNYFMAMGISDIILSYCSSKCVYMFSMPDLARGPYFGDLSLN